jgi:High potential iron-sulfur protein
MAAAHARAVSFATLSTRCVAAAAPNRDRFRSAGLLKQLESHPMNSRRHFIQTIPVACVAVCAGGAAFAADLPMVDEKDPQAAALGYVADATKADKAKFKTYAAGQNCAGCQLYQGKADPKGACPLFAGKNVAGKGWCSAFAKKA